MSISRRTFSTALSGSLIAMGLTQGTAVAKPATATGEGSRAAAADDPYTQAFLTQYGKIKDPANGYFSPDGLPYHSVETLMVEAPDHGHETTSEAFSYWMWLEAAYGRVTGDWDALQQRVGDRGDARSSRSTPISPPPTRTTRAPRRPTRPSGRCPTTTRPALDSSVPVGSDPIASGAAPRPTARWTSTACTG